MSSVKSDNVDHSRRRVLTAASTVMAVAGAAYLSVPLISYWQPSARAKAAGAPVEVDVSQLAPGQGMTVKWRGKPVYIIRRTKDSLAELDALTDQLADPESKEVTQQPSYAQNQHRSINPEYLVTVAHCTHLGCAPLYEPEPTNDRKRGFFCPCHGSKFDLAGRVYKSVPAPLNLVVPPYRFASKTTIVVGEDEVVA